MSVAPAPSPVNLERILSGAQLPALPQSAIRILELSRDSENGPAEFAVPIEADPGLTSQVLRFVNSSYFGFSREIASVKLAITLVGVRTIKNFTLWSAVFSLMPNSKCGQFQLKHLWQDSLRRALFSRAVGKALGLKDAEGPFAAALLQDLAVPLLARELPKEYERLIAQRDGGARRLSDLERERFGWTHATAGGIIARKWNLPDEFAAMIERHVDLDAELTAEPLRPGHVAVALSSLLPASADQTWHEGAAFSAAYQQLAPRGLPALEVLFPQLDQQFQEFAPVLDVGSPAKALAAYHQELLLASV